MNGYSVHRGRNERTNFGYFYLLPFEHGTKHYLVQGYNGNFSHRGIFALDFAMDT